MREISNKWNASERWVSKLAQDGRIPGVEQFNWLQAISKYAEKHADVSRPFCTVDDHSIQREGADLKERYYLGNYRTIRKCTEASTNQHKE